MPKSQDYAFPSTNLVSARDSQSLNGRSSVSEYEKFADQIIGKLSGGAVKRASLATSLIGDPKIIFLDEPSSGVDVANRKEVWDFLKSLKNKDRVILLTTHQLEEAEHIS